MFCIYFNFPCYYSFFIGVGCGASRAVTSATIRKAESKRNFGAKMRHTIRWRRAMYTKAIVHAARTVNARAKPRSTRGWDSEEASASKGKARAARRIGEKVLAKTSSEEASQW